MFNQHNFLINTTFFRKIANKLPWILELPTGLVKRVLYAVGILSGEKQQEIADELKKLRVNIQGGWGRLPTSSYIE